MKATPARDLKEGQTIKFAPWATAVKLDKVVVRENYVDLFIPLAHYSVPEYLVVYVVDNGTKA